MIQKEYCSDFDVRYAESVGREVIEPLAKYYFRLKTEGLEQLPDPKEGRPIIFLANHAGRCLPWDAILLDYTLSRYWVDELGLPTEDKPRSMAAAELSDHPLLVPFRLHNWWRRVGCLDATARNFHTLLKKGRSVIIFPEGIAGIARDFRDRYQLLPFSSSVVRMADRHDAWLVPVSIIGSEHFHPYANRSRFTDAIAKRLRLPFLPLSPFTFLLPLCPWIFYMALPAPVTIVIGAPYQLKEDVSDEAGWEAATEKLRQECQHELNQARAKHEKGWNWVELVRSLLSAPEPLWKLLPFGWPYRFISHARRKASYLFPNTPAPWRFLVPVLGWLKPEAPQTEEAPAQLPVTNLRPVASMPF